MLDLIIKAKKPL